MCSGDYPPGPVTGVTSRKCATLQLHVGERSALARTPSDGESWKRITARHQRRARHPRGCRNPTNPRWCGQPNCDEIGTGRVIRNSARAYYYCSDHDPWEDPAEELAA